MIPLILKLLYLIFIAYAFLALIISARDVMITKGSKLWIPLLVLLIAFFILLFATEYLITLILPFTLAISLPIFLTDKRRNWDFLDKIFRIASIIAILGALFITINARLR